MVEITLLISVSLDTPVYFAKGDKFSVVVTQYYIADDGTKTYISATNQAAGKNDPATELIHYYTKGVVNKGESFDYSETEGWQDFKEELDKMPNVKDEKVSVDNFPIKAYVDLVGNLDVTSEGATFKEGKAQADAVFVFGKNLKGLSAENFDTTKGVEIDGNVLDAENYITENGSIKLTIFKDYLNTLNVGEHTVRMYLRNSSTLSGLPEYTEANITVVKNDTPGGGGGGGGTTPSGDSTTEASASGTPQSGDYTIALIACLLTAMAASSVIVLRRRKIDA